MAEPIRLVAAGKRAAEDISAHLRELADKADRGQVESIVVSALIGGEYVMYHAATPADGLVLANLLHESALAKFRL